MEKVPRDLDRKTMFGMDWWREWTLPSLVKVMACGLCGAKLLPEHINLVSTKPLRTNFSEIWNKTRNFSIKKWNHSKIPSAKQRPFCSDSDMLTHCGLAMPCGGKDHGQHCFRQWLAAWPHQVITWTNVGWSSGRSFISLETPLSGQWV